MKNGMIECSVCHSKLVSPNTKAFSRAYDRHKSRLSSKQRVLNVLLVVGDCMLVGLQVCFHIWTFSLSFIVIKFFITRESIQIQVVKFIIFEIWNFKHVFDNSVFQYFLHDLTRLSMFSQLPRSLPMSSLLLLLLQMRYLLLLLLLPLSLPFPPSETPVTFVEFDLI